MDMNEALGHLGIKPDPVFTFNQAPDKIGLPTEHPRYVDRNCNDCYGRGFVRVVVMDGKTGVVFDDTKKRMVKNPNRTLRACHCVNKGYIKERLRAERMRAAVAAATKILPATR